MTQKQGTKSRKPKHQQVFERLREAIQNGEFGPGERLPTESALIRDFGVSRTTVIRALRDLQASGVLRRRRGSGTYVENSNSTPTKLVGLIVPDIEPGSIFITIQRALVREAEALGWTILPGEVSGAARDLPGAAAAIGAKMIEHHVDGAFYLPHAIAGPTAAINEKITETFTKAGIPLVLLDRDMAEFPTRSRFDVVSSDNERGGYIITEHLIHEGCRSIVFLGEQLKFPTTMARATGYRLAMEHHKASPIITVSGNPDSKQFIQQVLDKHKPDGIICNNDYDAAMVMRQLLQLGVTIPSQVRLAGFDDTPTAALLPIPLTTVRQPAEAIAFRATTLMRDRLARPSLPPCHVQIDCDIAVRNSTTVPHQS